MSIRDLFFMGYPAHEYELLPNGLLREARRCFKFQIKVAMMVSLLAQLFTIYNDYLIGGFEKTVLLLAVGVMVVSFIGMKSMIATGILFLYYLATFGYSIFYSTGKMKIALYLIAALFYIKTFFGHRQLKLIAKRGNIDSFMAMRHLVNEKTDVNGALQMMFESYDNDNKTSNANKVRFEKAFGVSVGGDADKPNLDLAAIAMMDPSELDVKIPLPSKSITDFSMQVVKEKFNDITNKIGGQKGEEKSRLEWYSYMKKDD